jgi:hypothetical protein
MESFVVSVDEPLTLMETIGRTKRDHNCYTILPFHDTLHNTTLRHDCRFKEVTSLDAHTSSACW